MTGRRVFSVAEAAEYLGVSRWTVYRRVEQGLLPHVKIGSRVSIPEFTLEKWLDDEARARLTPRARRPRSTPRAS